MPFSLQTLAKKRALARTMRDARCEMRDARCEMREYKGKAGKQIGPKPYLLLLAVYVSRLTNCLSVSTCQAVGDACPTA